MADKDVTTKLILQGDAGGMVAAVEQGNSSLNGLVGGTRQAESSLLSMASAVPVLVAAMGTLKLGDYIKDSIMLAARVETLGIVMRVVGNNAGYTGAQMEQYALAVAAMGITTESSRQSVIRMASAHMDLNHASELARIAQDAAVIGNINSSEAFEKMIYGIQSGQVDVLKTIGINVIFEDSYKKLGAQLGKNAKDLTENEKIQARTNVVIEKGTDIAGAYAASMDTAGKIINSMKRPAEETALSLGQLFTPSLNLLAKQFYGELSDISKSLKDGKPVIESWGDNILKVTISVESEFMRLAMLVDKLGGTLTTVAARSYTVAGVVTRAMTIGQFGQGFEDRSKGMKEANDMYAARYASTEAELVKLAEKYNQIGIKPAEAADKIRKQSEATPTSKGPKNGVNAWDSAHEKYLSYLETYNARQVASAKAGRDLVNFENEQGYASGLVSLAAYLDKKRETLKTELDEELSAAQKNLEARQKDLLLKSVDDPAQSPARNAQEYHAALKEVEKATIDLTNVENKRNIQLLKNADDAKKALLDKRISDAAAISHWAAIREDAREAENKAEFDHQNGLVAMAAAASEQKLSFLGHDDEALQLHHDVERHRILDQTQWKLNHLIMEESEKRRLNEETAAQLAQLDQQTAQKRAELWWSSSQQYIGFAQNMTTMATSLLFAEAGQREQIEKRMLASSVRFIAQGLQQFMLSKAKEHLLAAAAAAGRTSVDTAAATANLGLLQIQATAWAAFLWALAANPYGGEAVLDSAMAMTAVAGVAVPAAMTAATAVGAVSIGAELGMAAAWAAGGIAVGALGEAGAGAIEGSNSGQTAGYSVSGGSTPVVQPITPQNSGPQINVQIHLNGTVLADQHALDRWTEDTLAPTMRNLISRNVTFA